MAISQIANISHINQNSQLNAQLQANNINQTTTHNLINIQDFNDKIQKNIDIRPTEEIEKINKDSNPQNQAQHENNNEEKTIPQEKNNRTNIYAGDENLWLDIEV